VGEPEKKRLKEIVQTNIGPTERGFLEQVAREKPINSVPTYLGYGLSKKNLKKVFDYIKSWLIRYYIPFESVNPYLTIYLLDNLPKASIFINNIKNSKRGIIYKPKGTITVISNDERNFPRTIDIEPDDGKDYIVLNYVQDKKYNKLLERVFDSMDVNVLRRFCYVKLFEIESGLFKHKMYEDMMYSCPKIPDLRLGNVGLRRL